MGLPFEGGCFMMVNVCVREYVIDRVGLSVGVFDELLCRGGCCDDVESSGSRWS